MPKSASGGDEGYDPLIVDAVARVMAALAGKNGLGFGSGYMDWKVAQADVAKSLYAALSKAHIQDDTDSPAASGKNDDEDEGEDPPPARRKGGLNP